MLIPVSVNLISTSTLIIYIGCHRSLKLKEDPNAAPGQAVKSQRETITAGDAYRFPIVGSAALFSLYIAFKYFDKEIVNLLLSLYFSVVGTFTLTSTLSPFMSEFISNPFKHGRKFNLPLLGEIDATFTKAEFVCFILSAVFSGFYFKTKHFLMNNVFGISFCVQAIEKISLGSYKVAAILLVLLFFYDIFWVFGTDVMVTVAKSFDGPIKLLFPRVSIYTYITRLQDVLFYIFYCDDFIAPNKVHIFLIIWSSELSIIDPLHDTSLLKSLNYSYVYLLI